MNTNIKELKLDKKDKKILKELFLDARKSYSRIGKKTRLSKQVVEYRIKKLKERKIIKKFTIQVDNMKLGYQLYVLKLDLMTIKKETEQKLIDFFKNHEFVKSIASCTGVWDFYIIFCSKDITHFDNIMREFINISEKYLLNYSVNRILKEYMFPNNYLINENISYDYVKADNKVNYDEKDLIILKCLEKDSRITLPIIAKKVKLTSEAVKYRLKKLKEKKIIVKFIPEIDISSFDYEWYCISLNLKNKENKTETKIKTYLETLPEVISIIQYAGKRTIDFDIHVHTSQELLEVIDNIKNNYSEEIQDIQSMLVFKLHKNIHIPEGIKVN